MEGRVKDLYYIMNNRILEVAGIQTDYGFYHVSDISYMRQKGNVLAFCTREGELIKLQYKTIKEAIRDFSLLVFEIKGYRD